MRVITGSLKGRKIPMPNTEGVRPTADRTKESLFSVLTARKELRGASVLDLFAGSGNLGIEAISRGAARCLFVDGNPENIDHIKKLCTSFGIQDQVNGMSSDMMAYLGKRALSYDVIFCDPPYDFEPMEDMIELILTDGWLNPAGWFILEHDRRFDFSEHTNCVFSKAYGRTIVSIFLSYYDLERLAEMEEEA